MSYDIESVLQRLRPSVPPVILLGGGLDLIRPLGHARIPAIVASSNPHEPAFASRYCSGRIVLPAYERHQAVVDMLLDAGKQIAEKIGRRVPLFYGDDNGLNLIYMFRAQLEQQFLLLLNDPEICQALLDKDEFNVLARDRGIAAPETLHWDSSGRDGLCDTVGPVLIKPRMKMSWDTSPLYFGLFRGNGKARIFNNGSEVMHHPVARQFKDQLMFQKYIPGNDQHLWSFHGFADENGALLAWFVGHKLRTFPSVTGTSTYLEMKYNEEVACLGREIVRKVPLKGVFKIDFKHNAETGELHVLEINARFNLWHYLAERNGINLLKIAYEYLVHGMRPAPTQYRTTFRWLYLRGDIMAAQELSASGELRYGQWLFSLLASRKVYHLFCWTDMGPIFYCVAERVRSRSLRLFNEVGSWLRRWLSTAS